MIYVVQEGARGPVKIGHTTDVNPDLRLKSLQTGNPRRLFLRFWGEGDAKVERHLHARLWRVRLVGEWFTWCTDTYLLIEYGIEYFLTRQIRTSGDDRQIALDMKAMERKRQHEREQERSIENVAGGHCKVCGVRSVVLVCGTTCRSCDQVLRPRRLLTIEAAS